MRLPKGVNAVKVDKLVAWRLALAALTASEDENETSAQSPVVIRSAAPASRIVSLASASK
jgi:hypothetical protein